MGRWSAPLVKWTNLLFFIFLFSQRHIFSLATKKISAKILIVKREVKYKTFGEYPTYIGRNGKSGKIAEYTIWTYDLITKSCKKLANSKIIETLIVIKKEKANNG